MVRSDRGDIVLGWLTKVVVVLGVVALLGFDGVQVGLSSVQLQDQANDAATAARDSYAQHHDVATALTAAQDAAKADNSANVIVRGTFLVERDGAASVTLTRPIHTVVAHYLPVDAFKTATSGGSAPALP
jgi:hypothetical protein